MTNEEKILQMLEKMQSDITDIRADITDIRADITEIRETQEEHTTALNELIEWADEVQVVVRVPFAQPKPIQEAK